MLEKYGLWLRRLLARKQAGSHFVVGLDTQLLVYILAEPLSDVPQFLLQAFMRGSQLFGIGSIMEVAKDHAVGSCPRGAGHVSRMCPGRVPGLCPELRSAVCPGCVPDVSGRFFL